MIEAAASVHLKVRTEKPHSRVTGSSLSHTIDLEDKQAHISFIYCASKCSVLAEQRDKGTAQ